jgi:hypothetical protein
VTPHQHGLAALAVYLGGLAFAMVTITNWAEFQLKKDAALLQQRNAYWSQLEARR